MRIALVCKECRRREFGDPRWRCPHHPDKTVLQANHPYYGCPVPTLTETGLKLEDPQLKAGK